MPPMHNPESLTKDQLKKELIKHGVKPPDSKALKSVFIKLYKDKIVKKLSGFSSEEDELPVIRITRSAIKEPQIRTELNEVKVKVKRIDFAAARNMLVGGVIVSELSDEQLRNELEARGIGVGPVVDSTRKLYERKLEKLLRSAGTGDAKSEDESYEYSDQEEEEDEEEEIDVEETTPLQTWSRRPQLRSADRDGSATRRRAMRTSEEIRREIKEKVEQQVDETLMPSSDEKITPEKSERRWIPVWVAILTVVFIVVFLYLVIEAMESNPQKKIPHH